MVLIEVQTDNQTEMKRAIINSHLRITTEIDIRVKSITSACTNILVELFDTQKQGTRETQLGDSSSF